MTRPAILTLLGLWLLGHFIPFIVTMDQTPSVPRSRAEMTNYRETSRYEDVLRFVDAVAEQSKSVRVTSFGKTNEGRSLPVVVLSSPPTETPEAALRSRKLRVFIMANIHAGEVEGKEASLHLLRAIALGPLRPLLKDLTLLMAPIYNADSNERVSSDNRRNQKGPEGGVGNRENAQGLDLNRDFIKLETPEANALVQQVFNRWDPHVIIDLHTTNGSYHGYALTFAPALNPNGDERVIRTTREDILPAVRKRMKDAHGYETYFYGNFRDENHPEKGWETFDHRPRFGNNYVGLRNRIAILSEAYAYIDFRTRIDVTEKFVQSILEYSAQHARELIRVVAEADRRMRTPLDAGTSQLGIRFALRPLPQPVDILGNEVIAETDPATGKGVFRRTDKIIVYRTRDFGLFEATETRKLPAFYLIEPSQSVIIEKLRAHGIAVERFPRPLRTEVEVFRVDSLKRSPRPFQQHNEAKLAGPWRRELREFPAGTFRVSTRQPLGRLAFYLLEPESDDGLVTWNFFDDVLASLPADFPVYRTGN